MNTLKNKRGQGVLAGITVAVTIAVVVLVLLVLVLFVFSSVQTSIPVTTASIHNESNNGVIFINNSGYRVYAATNTTAPGVTNYQVVYVYTTGNKLVPPANYTITSTGYLKNTTAAVYTSVNLSYTYDYDGVDRQGAATASTNVTNTIPLAGLVLIIIIVGGVIAIIVSSLLTRRRS